MKHLIMVTVLLYVSCTLSKKNIVQKYYPDGYSLDFGYDGSVKEYFLRSVGEEINAIVPEFDSIGYVNNTLFISGHVIYPKVQIANRPVKITNAKIIYAYEKENSGRLTFIDSLGESNINGAFNLKINKPTKRFYLLFMKDSLIPCAQRFSSKKIKK